MFYQEKESVTAVREEQWILTEHAGFSCVRGSFTLTRWFACTGTRGWYSITAHYRLHLALFALPHTYTYEHARLCANNPQTSSQPQAPGDRSTGNWQR